jgi:hypothetical protein
MSVIKEKGITSAGFWRSLQERISDDPPNLGHDILYLSSDKFGRVNARYRTKKIEVYAISKVQEFGEDVVR